jgi:hypothetical protein
VDLIHYPPDGILNTEGVPYWVMSTDAPPQETKKESRQVDVLAVLNRHLKR